MFIIHLALSGTWHISALKQVALELQASEKERREEVGDLRDKVTKMLEKIMSGEISLRDRDFKDEKGRFKRPTLEDVFIDPLEESTIELDPHINVDTFDSSGDDGQQRRDLKGDVVKLKNLLNRKEKLS